MIINGIEFENQLTLKQIRLVYDYSIKEVAANLGVGETTYSRWEKNPKLMTIARAMVSRNRNGSSHKPHMMSSIRTIRPQSP